MGLCMLKLSGITLSDDMELVRNSTIDFSLASLKVLHFRTTYPLTRAGVFHSADGVPIRIFAVSHDLVPILC